jgi:hypothetical protein
MTNIQIISEFIETMGIEFNYDGKNLNTFQAWKGQGFSVKKGETAFIKVPLWTCKLETVKDKDGKVVKDENGKPKKEKVFYRKTSALFRMDQVEPIQNKVKKTA